MILCANLIFNLQSKVEEVSKLPIFTADVHRPIQSEQMEFGIGKILEIAGSLAFFIFGMKMMSEGIQRAAGSQLRNILRSMTKNRYLGVFTGFLITALVQSSSATTVMTVSFVNAGLLTLVESAGVMMGANIGTTITGWIISFLGFKVKLSAYSIPLFAIGLPMLFSQKGKLKHWGEFVIGFAILFLGLTYLKDSVPTLSGESTLFTWLSGVADYGFFSNVLFVLVGTVVTIVVQSSSAAMAVTLTMCAQGWLPFDVAAAMILGENIGTTITAELASLVGNTNAKRSARIHSLFNIIGVTWMVIALPFVLPFLGNFVDNYLTNDGNPFTSATAMPIGLSAFHTFFNLTNVIIMLFLVPWLVRTAIWSVPPTDGDEEEGLKFITNASRTPELATVEVQKEAHNFGEVVQRIPKLINKLLNDTSDKKRRKALKKLKKYEEITDYLEVGITEYITKLADQKITSDTSKKLRSIINICNDLERIGDVYFQIARAMERKFEENIYFLPEQRNNLNIMNGLVTEAFDEMVSNLKKPEFEGVSIDKAMEIEDRINTHCRKLRNDNLAQIGTSEYNVQSSIIYTSLFNMMESVGDHIINVTENIVGES